MSASQEEREDATRMEEEDLGEAEMTDMAGLPAASNDNTTGRDDDASHHISELLEEERQQDSQQPAGGDTGVVNRYKQLALDEPDVASDTGSADALPRRVGSPVDSTASIPDDSPSIQVCSHARKNTSFPRENIS